MGKQKQPEHCLLLKVGVVAKESRCLSIMKALHAVRPSHLRFKLVAMAMISGSTAGKKYAAQMGVQLFENPRDLLHLEFVDLILELTGEPAIMTELISRKPPTMGIMDRQTAMLFLDIAATFDPLKENETQIHLATSFASALLEASPDGVFVIDRNYRIINCNNSPLINGDAEWESPIGQFCHEVMHRSTTPCAPPERECPIHETMKSGRPSRAVHEITMMDGAAKICQVTTYPIVNHIGEISQFVVTIRDMTKELSERVEKQAQSIKENLARFVQDDRLASLGRLVASVCHEINNPITSIVTFNKLILSYVKENRLDHKRMKDVERYLGLSVREALRCGEIVKNLLTFARQKKVQAKSVDLIEIVDTIMMLVDHQLKMAGIACKIDLPAGPYRTRGDSAQIQQCLMNLIFNAIDAMPQGGTMTINGGVDAQKEMIWMTISDTGQGIETEALPHIFEPFYSTKTDGKGVGLGLSMVYGIIREHNGSVEVNSEVGQGSTFRIRLPWLQTDSLSGVQHASFH